MYGAVQGAHAIQENAHSYERERQFEIPPDLADQLVANILKPKNETGAFFVPGKRRRLNVVWILLVAVELFNKRGRDREPMWLGFILFTMLLALSLGTYAGNAMYENTFLPYYDMMSLNDYPNVNPATEPGDIYLDAGFMGFVDGTELDLKIVGMYVHEDTFCVAPIVNTKLNSGVPKTGSYDFRAVGKNCCNDPPGVFMCGAARNVEAGQGLRETNMKDKDNYLHAIQQANAKYDITTQYPLMVHWVQDPLKLIGEVYNEG